MVIVTLLKTVTLICQFGIVFLRQYKLICTASPARFLAPPRRGHGDAADGIRCFPVYCTHHSHTPSFVLADAMSDPEREDVFYSVSLSPFILSRPPHQEKTCEDITPH